MIDTERTFPQPSPTPSFLLIVIGPRLCLFIYFACERERLKGARRGDAGILLPVFAAWFCFLIGLDLSFLICKVVLLIIHLSQNLLKKNVWDNLHSVILAVLYSPTFLNAQREREVTHPRSKG